MKLSSKISKKKIEAERNLEKMEKISTYQKKFAERVMKKEIPNLLQWMERQRDFHFEIKKKIEVNLIKKLEMRRIVPEISKIKAHYTYR